MSTGHLAWPLGGRRVPSLVRSDSYERTSRTYRTLGVEPHHANDLAPVVIRVDDGLAQARDVVQRDGDGADGHPAGRVDDGQLRAGLVPGEMDERMAAVGVGDGGQRRVLAEHPPAVRGPALEVTDADPQAVLGDVCDASQPRPGDLPTTGSVSRALPQGDGTYWQQPRRRISSSRWARPLVAGADDRPSSREVGSPKRSSTSMPSSMIRGMLLSPENG